MNLTQKLERRVVNLDAEWRGMIASVKAWYVSGREITPEARAATARNFRIHRRQRLTAAQELERYGDSRKQTVVLRENRPPARCEDGSLW